MRGGQLGGRTREFWEVEQLGLGVLQEFNGYISWVIGASIQANMARKDVYK